MSSDTFIRVRRIIASYLGTPEEAVAEESRLQDLGVDSLSALELIFLMEEEFGVSVPDHRVADFTTVRDVCAGIEALRAPVGPR